MAAFQTSSKGRQWTLNKYTSTTGRILCLTTGRRPRRRPELIKQRLQAVSPVLGALPTDAHYLSPLPTLSRCANPLFQPLDKLQDYGILRAVIEVPMTIYASISALLLGLLLLRRSYRRLGAVGARIE
jgi:hypothetical protein